MTYETRQLLLTEGLGVATGVGLGVGLGVGAGGVGVAGGNVETPLVVMVQSSPFNVKSLGEPISPWRFTCNPN